MGLGLARKLRMLGMEERAETVGGKMQSRPCYKP